MPHNAPQCNATKARQAGYAPCHATRRHVEPSAAQPRHDGWQPATPQHAATRRARHATPCTPTRLSFTHSLVHFPPIILRVPWSHIPVLSPLCHGDMPTPGSSRGRRARNAMVRNTHARAMRWQRNTPTLHHNMQRHRPEPGAPRPHQMC